MSATMAQLASSLTWLAPSASALAALSMSDSGAARLQWSSDPAALALFYRSTFDHRSRLAFALDCLRRPPVGVVELSHASWFDFARRLGDEAERQAKLLPGVEISKARDAATLAPLGQIALAAVGGDEDSDPAEAASVARRLVRRWGFPNWLTAILSNLDADPKLAVDLGADPTILEIVHSAIASVPRNASESAAFSFESPYGSRSIVTLLELAIESRSIESNDRYYALETENEKLRAAISDRKKTEATRLHDQKLAAIAEFAAGAGHEINNPLAVMSGQAQYLMIRETDPERQKSLQTIVQQTHRVHSILTDLMQFAKPQPPRKAIAVVADLVHDVVTSLTDIARSKNISFEVVAGQEMLRIEVDPRQIHSALSAIVQNAVEAAGSDGWVRLTVQSKDSELQIVVEDSGNGPSDADRIHMFEPFYSGRHAGRGRGLGLPKAWRLARENAGDLLFEPTATSPARFVLKLPLSQPIRLIA